MLFAVALVPVGLVMSSFAYAHRQWSKRQVPSGVRGNIAIMGGASLMEAQAKYLYPNRAESDQLVMFYLELDSPDADLKAMERHVRELVELLEKPLRAKIHWVRGPLLGQRNVSFLGLALGSDHSLDWDRQGALDRHELAHAVLNQYRLRSADPPMLLHEGWAEAKSGVGKSTLVQIAVDARSNNSNVTLADVMRGTNYRLDTGLAYTYGGAFVDFLLRHFSTPQFVDIYNRCGPETFEEDFQDVYSVSLTQLEEAFWREANQIVQHRSLPR